MTLVVIGAVAFAAGPSLARTAHRPTCRPPGADVVASTRKATLFFTWGDGEYPPSTLHACLRSLKRPVVLERFDGEHAASLARIHFDGSYVAFDETDSDVICSKYDPGPHCITGHFLLSYNMRSGKVRAAVRRAQSDALVLATNGWIAWVPPASSPGERSVRARDSTGRRVLDTGAIDVSSLGCSGRTVRWTNAGVPRSARLR